MNNYHPVRGQGIGARDDFSAPTFLDEMDYHPFQFNSWPVTETVWVALEDDLCWELDQRSGSLLVLLGFATAFNTISHPTGMCHWGLGGIAM